MHAPFGCYPGSMPGRYGADVGHLMEFGAAQVQGKMDEYLEKWVFGASSHEELLEQRVGREKLEELRAQETVHEGYDA